ncbi:MAG: hypothetical protein NT154_36505 [Verrucomicrobia bacterium]|nr:hypothetical protein [Verrucomicrobiota bacterium]
MKTTDHHELLRAYAQDHSESAFQELVQRYVDLVYSAIQRLERCGASGPSSPPLDSLPALI